MDIRKFILIALVASPFLAACMPDAPDTQLSWDANTRITKNQARAGAPARVARNEPRPLGARTYVYEDKYAPKSRTPDYVNGNGAYDDTYGPTPRPAPYAATAYTPVASQPLAPVSGAPNFAWPISGRVISDFGSIANGGRNDGINIAAPTGAPIHASASGTVTYAGDQLKGYGNLVLVKHAGGYTTAYAHADRTVVQKGDVVTRGQIIGYAGQTGDVSQPQLHFEIRSNTTPVNPRSYLSNTTASNGY
jgi:murein DD-endopeptidase MepM/ murein hydrolase activator NlpD